MESLRLHLHPFSCCHYFDVHVMIHYFYFLIYQIIYFIDLYGISPSTPAPLELLSRFLMWMSRQDRVLASIPIMTDIYRALYEQMLIGIA